MRRQATIAGLLVFAATTCAVGQQLLNAEAARFAASLDCRAVGLVPVQYRGRVGILDTVAREQLARICGRESLDGLGAPAAYLELHFNAGAYLDKPVIYIREKALREFIEGRLTGAALEDFKRTRSLPPAALVDTQATDLLLHAGRAEPADLARASNVPSLRGALASLGDQPEFRLPLERLSERYFAFLAADPDSPGGPETWRLLPKGAGRQLLDELQAAWRARDVHAVNALPARIDELCRSAGGGAPSAAVRRMELIYNRMRQFTVVFAGFALALVLMIVAAASSSRTVRRAGLAVFALSTAALAAGFVARWVLSGRAWYLPPVMNQFEAVVGSALLASVVAILLEWAYGRNYFALAAAFYATAALLGGLIFPEAMAAGMSAAHGILDSPVMGLHVAVIVVGHAMAGMTLVISAAYLAAACRRALAGRPLDSSGADLSDPADGRDALATIDRCNLIVAQLAAWSIVAGTMLGAYWGDFAWGRWWGWDPKETWALMTALVYLAVLHLRLVTPPSRRGLLTAVGCIVGCAVMLFNWTVVNYLIVGKHSYA